MKKIIIILAAVIGGYSMTAQQDAMYTHYSFNTLAVNPAYAGSRDALTATALHRSQWVGFEGAPVSQTLTIHSPAFNQKMGLGLSILNDQIGPISTTSIYADFAYKFPIGEKGKLAFGLKAGINLMQGSLSTLELDDGLADDAFQNDIETDLLPNFGFGIYYSTEKWYLGISTPKLMENDFELNQTMGSEKRHYFFITGMVLDIKKDGSLKFKPTTLLKATEGAPLVGDITGLFIFQDKLEAGLMYRTNAAAGLLLGYNISNQIRLGYSFDWSFTNATSKYNSGSHEIMLRYDFIYKNKSKVKSPRYF